MTKATIGEVISGTLRSEDLIQAFAGELQRIADPKDNDAFALINAAYDLDVEDGYIVDQDIAGEIIDDLITALSYYAPPYCYFGSIDGDGACFGFWPDFDALDFYGDDLLRADDLSAIPDDYSGEALVINDHGNASLYSVTKGTSKLVWAIV